MALPKIDTSDIESIRSIVDATEAKHTFSLSPFQFSKILSTIRHIVGVAAILRLKVEEGQLFLSSQ